MKHRIGRLLERDPSGLWIGTFHSLVARLLRREAELLGFTRRFTIYDEDDRLSLIKRLMEQRGHSTKMFPPRAVQSLISAAKNRMVPPDELAAVGAVRPSVAGRRRRVRRDGPRAPGGQRDGLRRPAAASAHALPGAPGPPAGLSGALQLHPGGRVPGHQQGAVPADPAARRARQRLRRGRRRPVDLWLARGRRAQHAGLPQGFSRRQAGPAGGELPVHPGGARRRQRRDRREHAAGSGRRSRPGGGAASR